MKLEIFDWKKNDEKPIRLALVSERGVIDVVCVDENGLVLPRGRLIRFNNEGTVTRVASVNPDLGFMLDHVGRIMEGCFLYE